MCQHKHGCYIVCAKHGVSQKGFFEGLTSRKGRFTMEYLSILIHRWQTHWASHTTFQHSCLFIPEKKNEDCFESYFIQDKRRVLTPAIWHKKNKVGRVHQQYHSFHPSLRIIIRAGKLACLAGEWLLCEGINVHSCFQICLHYWC